MQACLQNVVELREPTQSSYPPTVVRADLDPCERSSHELRHSFGSLLSDSGLVSSRTSISVGIQGHAAVIRQLRPCGQVDAGRSQRSGCPTLTPMTCAPHRRRPRHRLRPRLAGKIGAGEWPTSPGLRDAASDPGPRMLERATGIEPAPSVWKTEALPLSYARDGPRVEACRQRTQCRRCPRSPPVAVVGNEPWAGAGRARESAVPGRCGATWRVPAAATPSRPVGSVGPPHGGTRDQIWPRATARGCGRHRLLPATGCGAAW